MEMLEAFEHARLREFAEYEDIPLAKRSWRTPDGQTWTPQAVLTGWRPRISDRWAWITLHAWIAQNRVRVDHVELPSPLVDHHPDDAAWAHVDRTFGPGDREPHAPLGRSDLACQDGAGPLLMVEFGSCAPAKFVFNLGRSPGTHWMLVPYGCPYAFVFIAGDALLDLPRRKD